MDLAEKIWMTEVTWAEGANVFRNSTVVNRPDWFQVTTPTLPHAIGNGVYRSVIPDDQDPETVIDEVFAHYRGLGLPFRWTVGPSARPADLAERLIRRGMEPFSLTAGMVADATALSLIVRPGVTVERVTPDTAREYAQASMAGWGFGSVEEEPDEGFLLSIRDQLARGDDVILVLARCEGELAGAGTLQFIHGIGHLKGTAVRPEMRGRGVYQSMVAWRLQVMQERGVRWAAIQAVLDTSAPICRRLGFEEVCRIDIYHTPEPRG